MEAFATYLGHTTVNSGAFKRRLAALKDWGLITARGDLVALTDLGRRLALPPDPASAAADRRTAFAQSEVFMRLHDRSAKGIAIDENHLANTAVHELGIAPVSKERFIRSFVESAIYVGLADRPAPGQVRLLTWQQSAEAPLPPEPKLPSETTVRPELAQPLEPAFPVVLKFPWEFQGGEILLEIRLHEPPTGAVFDELSQVTAAIRRLVEAMKG